MDAILGTALISIGSADEGSVQLDADDIQAQHVKIESANRRITALSSPTQAQVTVNGERIVSATLECRRPHRQQILHIVCFLSRNLYGYIDNIGM